MIIDSSAVMTILRSEPDHHRYSSAIATADSPIVMPAATFLEAAIVADRAYRSDASGISSIA